MPESPLARKGYEGSNDERHKVQGDSALADVEVGSRWLLEWVVASSSDAVISTGLDGVISGWNAGAERMYGYSAAEAVGRAHELLVPAERRDAERASLEGVLLKGTARCREIKRVHKSGAGIDVLSQMSPARDAAGALAGVLTVERRRNQLSSADRLPKGEGYLHSAFEHAPIGIALVGIDAGSSGQLLRVNRALCALTGYSPAELTGSQLEALVHPDDLASDLAAMNSLAAGERASFQLEQRLIHAGRHAVWVMVHASLVSDSSGRPLYCIRQLQDIEERKRFEGELGYLADHDPLTGLLNRRGFVRELTQQIAHARRYGAGGAVLFLDLDDFKYINDTLGHSVGDEVISGVARVVSDRLRETDVFARLGGDEFAVLLPHATVSDARTLSISLLEAVRTAEGLVLREGSRRITASVGVTAFHEPAESLAADDILIDADLAMYAAKEAGKDRVEIATTANQQRMRFRLTWSERVRRAVDTGSFELYCQPIVDLASDQVCQWELLLRLPGDRDELILPAQFLYTAERSGLILALDRWVLGEAIALIAAHRDAGRDLRLEIDLSGRSFGDAELPGFIEQRLSASQVDPASLVLEVTETAAIANIDRARKFAEVVRDLVEL